MGRSSRRIRPSELRWGDRTVLARKGSLRRAEAARPCALRAVLSGWFRDGRLRRDELRELFSTTEYPKANAPGTVYTDSLTPPPATARHRPNKRPTRRCAATPAKLPPTRTERGLGDPPRAIVKLWKIARRVRDATGQYWPPLPDPLDITEGLARCE